MKSKPELTERAVELARGTAAVAGLALWSPSQAFPLMTAPIAVLAFLFCLLARLGTLVGLMLVQPSFFWVHFKEEVEAGGSTSTFTSYCLGILGMRASLTVWSVAMLSACWFFLGQFIKRSSSWDSYLLGGLGTGLLVVYLWLQLGELSHPNLAVAAFVFWVACTWVIMDLRHRHFGRVVWVVVLAGLPGTLGFIIRYAISAAWGHDTGTFSLAGFASHQSWVEPWLARIDIFGLWWCLVASAGFAKLWDRSYGSVLTVTILGALCFMLFYPV